MSDFNENELIENWQIKTKPYASIVWTDYINCTPIKDLRNWQLDLANLCGIYGNVIEFNIKTFNYIPLCLEHKGWEVSMSKPSDLLALLGGGRINPPEIIINENLKDGKVIIKSKGEFLPGYYKDVEATVF